MFADLHENMHIETGKHVNRYLLQVQTDMSPRHERNTTHTTTLMQRAKRFAPFSGVACLT